MEGKDEKRFDRYRPVGTREPTNWKAHQVKFFGPRTYCKSLVYGDPPLHAADWGLGGSVESSEWNVKFRAAVALQRELKL